MADVRSYFVCNIDYIEYVNRERTAVMRRTTTMAVRLGGTLGEFVAANAGGEGSYKTVSEYIRDLIRQPSMSRVVAARIINVARLVPIIVLVICLLRIVV